MRTSILEFKEAKLQQLAWRQRHLKKDLGPGRVGGKGLHLEIPSTIYKGCGAGCLQQVRPRCCQMLGRNGLCGRGEAGDWLQLGSWPLQSPLQWCWWAEDLANNTTRCLCLSNGSSLLALLSKSQLDSTIVCLFREGTAPLCRFFFPALVGIHLPVCATDMCG